MKAIRLIAIIIISIAQIIYSQESPAWLPMGDLYRADQIWTFLEIPGTSIILAGGRADRDEAGIWKSVDGGENWVLKLHTWYTWDGVREFAFDQDRNIIFACVSNIRGSYLEWDPLWYSTDLGETWKAISNPPNLGYRAGIHSIVLSGNKLYVAFEEVRPENGNSWGIYSAMLYRLDITSSAPEDWKWEFVMQYPELDYLMRLTINNGKLYVFGKDYERDAIRIFTHSLQQLNAKAKPVGTVREIQQYIEQLETQKTSLNKVPEFGETEGDLQ